MTHRPIAGESPQTCEVELLLFDLGGVILDFVGLSEVGALLPEPLLEEEIRTRWLESPCIRAFEVGGMSPEAFAKQFVAEWRLRISPGEFLARFEEWNRGLLPGAAELLAELVPHYRLAALSNSNELHWRLLQEDTGIDAFFELALSSHELGRVKPDRRAYESALARLGVAPEAVVFLDDNLPNVEGATNVGIRAYLARGIEGARAALREAGVLPLESQSQSEG